MHLSVRYSTAREFVTEYAENLSKGGLFLKDAHEIAPLQMVAVRLQLPGFREYEILAQVVHIVPPDTAALLGRSAGAGMAIVHAPEGFQQALEQYLQRLGQRKDHQVFIADEAVGILLSSCGYRVARAPVPSEVRQAVAEAVRPVIGVIVPDTLIDDYRRALVDTSAGTAVHGIDSFADIDDMLTQLDSNLMAHLMSSAPEPE